MVENEARIERATKVIPAWKEDCGWGAPDTEFEGVHFKSVIRASLQVLEKHALERDSSLRACPQFVTRDDFSKSEIACNVPDFLERIRVALKGELDGKLCRGFLEFHGKACEPGSVFTEKQFRSFLAVLREILRIIQCPGARSNL